MKIVERPEAVGKKINCYEEFELCYLRHKYFRKAKINPTEEQMKPFNGVIRMCARRTYYTYLGLFQSVGMEIEDIISTCKAHLVSYLGLYSVQLPEEMDKFIDSFVDANGEGPDMEDIMDKDKADFTLFLKQRMEDMVRICRQKVRNIRGQLAEEFLVFYGPKLPPEGADLARHYHKLGFKKLDASRFKALRKRTAADQTGPIYTINKLFYITIPLDHRQLTVHDLAGAGLDPYQALHNMNPEEIMLQIATENEFQKKKKVWRSTPRDARIKKIREFIALNANNPMFADEIKTARRMIKE